MIPRLLFISQVSEGKYLLAMDFATNDDDIRNHFVTVNESSLDGQVIYAVCGSREFCIDIPNPMHRKDLCVQVLKHHQEVT